MRGLRWVAAASVAASLVATGESAPADGAFPGRNGRIAFSSDRHVDAGAEIYALGADGRAARNLTRRAGHDFRPVVSPDRRRVLFCSGYEGSASLWVMNGDGTRRRALGLESVCDADWAPDSRRIVYADGGRISVAAVDGPLAPTVIAEGGRPAWSADGRWIAYARFDLDRGSEIHVVRPDGSGARLLHRTELDAVPGRPRWSPRSDSIAFAVEQTSTGRSEIRVVDLAGGEARTLAHGRQPAWSPDGRTIAFSRLLSPVRAGVVLVRLDGRGERVVTSPSAARDVAPAWSPDGRWIAFGRIHRARTDVWLVGVDRTGLRRVRRERTSAHLFADDGPVWLDARRLLVATAVQAVHLELFTVSPDGRGLRRLTRNDVDEREPAWSPDGRRIAFIRNRADRPESLWVARADGKEQRQLVRDGAASPAWSPDGRRLAFAHREFVWRIAIVSIRGGPVRLVRGALGTEPAWSPDGRRIVFVRAIEGAAPQLAVVPAGGGSPTTITVPGPDQARALSPDWSPDGRWIVFVRVVWCGPACTQHRLARVRPDGSGLEDLALGPASTPAFSPDGRSVVYSSVPQAGGELRILRVGGAARTITRGRGTAWQPDWQPLSRR